jgi:hypothetical protein
LQSGSDIHSVAVNVVVFSNHFAKVNTDAKQHARVVRTLGVVAGELILHIKGGARRLDDARKFGDQPVASSVNDPAAMRFNQPPRGIPVLLECVERSFLISPH